MYIYLQIVKGGMAFSALGRRWSVMTQRSGRLILAYALLLFTIAETRPSNNSKSYRSLYGQPVHGARTWQSLINVLSGGTQFLQDGSRYMDEELRDRTPSPGETFDFIVVGAGSAGAAVASRLSEIRDATVLLIEAGRSESLIMDIPLLVNYLQLNSDVNWKYSTEPSDRYCLGMTNRSCNWPRGKVMGGSSVLNYMIATRGYSKDYDHWAELGNTGWSYKEVLPYFKKLESVQIPRMQRDVQYRNSHGPMPLDYTPFHTPLAESFVAAGAELGYPNIDYNSRERVGYSYIQFTMKNGERWSSNRAYLHPIRNRRNLYHTRHSMVSKVLIDPKTKTAYGVEFIKNGKKIRVKARKEVILSAGAIGSPQILMLSGVGPADHLRDVGIPVIKDAPVGKNLMDHIAYGGLVFMVNQPVGLLASDVTNPAHPYLGDYLRERKGPLTIPGGVEGIAFFNVDKEYDPNSYANMEFMFISGSLVSDWLLHEGFGISRSYWNKYYDPIFNKYSWSIFPMLLRPKSRGTILLRDKYITSKPRIIPNYMNDTEDIRILIKGVREAIRVSKTKAMQKFGSKMYDVPVMGCEQHEYDSDAYWECAIRTFTFTIYHYSGTCKMGPENDPTAVVNPRLQVIGVKKLRVADASIMPEIITGHTHIPTVMIGEKLADMVKEDWGYKPRPPG